MKSDKKRKIAVVLVDRCNYGRMKPVMQAIKDHPELELLTFCTGTMVLERFGRPVNIVKKDGFDVEEEIFIEIEGSNPTTAAKTLGLAVIEFTNAFSRVRPDIVLIIGDRFEALAAMLAASYQNFCIAHIQGGEVSYSNDEVTRHLMSKMSHYHFPATIRSAQFLEMMGEDPKCIFPFGCPVVDVINDIDPTLSEDMFKDVGLGKPLAPDRDYFLVIFHPISTQYRKQEEQVGEILKALQKYKIQTLWLWANIDPGSNSINKTLRMYHEYEKSDWLYFVKNFSPEKYQKILANARCAIGNSSSFIRDASVWGTPVIVVGDRQKGRETGKNVIACTSASKEAVAQAIEKALNSSPIGKDTLYGVPGVSKKIADKLAEVTIYIQKHIHYVNEECEISYKGDSFTFQALSKQEKSG